MFLGTKKNPMSSSKIYMKKYVMWIRLLRATLNLATGVKSFIFRFVLKQQITLVVPLIHGYRVRFELC